MEPGWERRCLIYIIRQLVIFSTSLIYSFISSLIFHVLTHQIYCYLLCARHSSEHQRQKQKQKNPKTKKQTQTIPAVKDLAQLEHHLLFCVPARMWVLCGAPKPLNTGGLLNLPLLPHKALSPNTGVYR